jgi:hypothetical protein
MNTWSKNFNGGDQSQPTANLQQIPRGGEPSTIKYLLFKKKGHKVLLDQQYQL